MIRPIEDRADRAGEKIENAGDRIEDRAENDK